MQQSQDAGQQGDFGPQKFSLRAGPLHLLPQGRSLVADPLRGVLLVVDWQQEQVLAISSGELSEEQFELVCALLGAWPSYVPYEKLLRQLAIPLSPQDGEDLERIRTSGSPGETEAEQVLCAQARARIAPMLDTLRAELGACRPVLNALGLDISAVLDYGPLLVGYLRRAEKVVPAGEVAG
jgi:hypothetical protein